MNEAICNQCEVNRDPKDATNGGAADSNGTGSVRGTEATRGHSRPKREETIQLDRLFLDQDQFLRMLTFERKRTERSHRRFVLVLLESAVLLNCGRNPHAFQKLVDALFRASRETDIKGWYRTGATIGVIFTELGSAEGVAVANALLAKIFNALGEAFSIEDLKEIRLSFHVFPENWNTDGDGTPTDPTLYPDLAQKADLMRGARMLKRSMDIVGSACALMLLSPVFATIAVLIKLTSRGPVIFRQVRIGQYGRPFTFLKFRSMYVSNDHQIHKEYMKQLILGTNAREQTNGARTTVYKLTQDARVTPLGEFLRKTSLDELPQLVNVLKGEMSLVGPRPPIPYEVQQYDIWHRRRVLATRPGMTGLWQVEGRSRVGFNDMVRMDLRYASSWSPALDLQILLRTPKVVFSGDGAY